MSERITICSIGAVDRDLLAYLARGLAEDCGLHCEIGPGLKTPADAYDIVRHQYNSKTILKRLIQRSRTGGSRLLGVTPVDLYIPILKYVYGLAQIEGPCALISTCRLSPRYYDAPDDRQLFFRRVRKTALHELGHTLGLTHCRSRRCVMHSSVRIEDTDAKDGAFCATCAELFRWKLQNPGPQP